MSPLPAMPVPRPIWVDGIRWTLAPEAADLLLPTELSLELLREQGRVEQVKHGPHRTVYRVRLESGAIYWKHCRVCSPRAFLRECIRPPKARLEFDKARTLAARGIPTVCPLAWGTRSPWFPGESFLITQALEDTTPLNVFLEHTLPALPRPRRTAARRELAAELGRFLARLHDAGVVHPDLHPGNLLISWPLDGAPRFYLIDLHAIQVGRPLGAAASRANLVLLNRWFVLRAGRSDRLRCWREYSRLRGFAFADARAWEEATWESNRGFWRARDRRPCGNNRYFRKVSSSVARGHTVREFDESFLNQLLADPDAPFRAPGARFLKDSRSSTVVEVAMPTPAGLRPMIYKRFRVTKWTDPVANVFRRSPALRSWVLGHGLRDRDLPTPRPWLVLHRRRRGLPAEGYLLCDKVPAATDLRDWVFGLSDRPAPEARSAKWTMIDRVARLLRTFHQRRLAHRDLKAANILVHWGTDDQPALALIDLVGVRVHHRLSEALCVQNLMRLHASFHNWAAITRTDKLRFLRMYLNWALVGRGDWKNWWNRLAAATRAKVERNAKRGRSLA